MKHTVIIRSKNQQLFTKIEEHIVISEEEIEQLALDKYKKSIDDNEGKSFWAELALTEH